MAGEREGLAAQIAAGFAQPERGEAIDLAEATDMVRQQTTCRLTAER